MAIVETCQYCGHQVTAPDAFGGSEVDCPACGELILLPMLPLDLDEMMPATVELGSTARSSAVGTQFRAAPHDLADRLLVRCDKCFQRYLVPPTAIDQLFDCPKCEHTFRVPREALDAKRRSEIAAASGLSESVVADAAPNSPTLGAEMLVEVGLIDEQQSEGAPLREQRIYQSWVPRRIRRRINAVTTFVQYHILGLMIAVVLITTWFVALTYVLW